MLCQDRLVSFLLTGKCGLHCAALEVVPWACHWQPFLLGLGQYLEIQPENAAGRECHVVKGHRALSSRVTFFLTGPAVLCAEVVFSRADKRLMLFKASFTQHQPSSREGVSQGAEGMLKFHASHNFLLEPGPLALFQLAKVMTDIHESRACTAAAFHLGNAAESSVAAD